MNIFVTGGTGFIGSHLIDALTSPDSQSEVYALVRDLPLAEAVRWAVVAGAVTATRPGAQSSLPAAAEVDGLAAAPAS